MPEALPAVTVPSFSNAGRSPARVSRVVSGLGCSSRVDGGGPAAADLDRGDLLGERGLRGLGGGRAALRLDRELVLLVAADAVLAGDVLGGDTHVDAVERVGEHRDGAVDQGAVAEPVAAAGVEVVERHAGHVLVAAGQGQSTPPQRICIAADHTACRPEPQSRLTV